MENTLSSTSTDFNSKYADMISEKNFYGLLLKVKTEMRKLAKKDAKEFLNLLVWSIKILSDNNEGESSITLIIYAIDEYDKNVHKNDLELCLEKFKQALQNLPEKFEENRKYGLRINGKNVVPAIYDDVSTDFLVIAKKGSEFDLYNNNLTYK